MRYKRGELRVEEMDMLIEGKLPDCTGGMLECNHWMGI